MGIVRGNLQSKDSKEGHKLSGGGGVGGGGVDCIGELCCGGRGGGGGGGGTILSGEGGPGTRVQKATGGQTKGKKKMNYE